MEWARAFGCPVYTSAEDASWLQRRDEPGLERRLIRGATETILPGVTAIKTGGHFDGSLVLHYDKSLFIADSLMTVEVSARAKQPWGALLALANLTLKQNHLPQRPLCEDRLLIEHHALSGSLATTTTSESQV